MVSLSELFQLVYGHICVSFFFLALTILCNVIVLC